MVLSTNLDGANDGAFNNFGWCCQMMMLSTKLDGAVNDDAVNGWYCQ